MIQDELRGERNAAEALGHQMGERLISRGADKILAELAIHS